MPVESGVYYFFHEPDGASPPPIVLIHGAGGSHLSWPPELRRLPNRDVYSIDLPGHGKSEGHGEQTLGGYADRVAEWMDSLRLFRAFVVGHSMGGGIALELALRYPHRTAGLCLIGAGARLPIPEDLMAYAANPATYPSALEILRRMSFGPKMPANLADLVIRRLGEVRPSVVCNDLQACAQFDFTEKLPEVRRPVLVVCGSEDQMAPLRLSQFLASKLENAELRVIPGGGHMLMLEKGAELAEIVSEYLRGMARPY